MRIESLEQRVAKAPASLLCDDCMHSECCMYRENMKQIVVKTDNECKIFPFKSNGWTCMYFYKGTAHGKTEVSHDQTDNV